VRTGRGLFAYFLATQKVGKEMWEGLARMLLRCRAYSARNVFAVLFLQRYRPYAVQETVF